MVNPRHERPISTAVGPLTQFVWDRLPDDMIVTDRDLDWLVLCGSFLGEVTTNESVLTATKAALRKHPLSHVDPFELLIEAGICDVDCRPIS